MIFLHNAKNSYLKKKDFLFYSYFVTKNNIIYNAELTLQTSHREVIIIFKFWKGFSITKSSQLYWNIICAHRICSAIIVRIKSFTCNTHTDTITKQPQLDYLPISLLYSTLISPKLRISQPLGVDRYHLFSSNIRIADFKLDWIPFSCDSW